MFDGAHWWVNVLDRLFAIFPDAKAIGLCREVEPCVRSFVSIKGSGRKTWNHWVPPANGIWQPNLWDPLYPTYPLPDYAQLDPDRAKADVVRRYINDYNRDLESLASRFPGRVMLVRTEELNRASAQQRLFEFVGLSGRPRQVRLNVGTISDGEITYRF